ncbi:MCE family protein [Mycolicibacterium sp. 3033]|nr:MCE family protein [Mycolicibacterium aurantiacum]
MTPTPRTLRFAAAVMTAVVTSGCGYHGLNSLSLPGTVGGRDAVTYHVELVNVGTLESNSPVLVNDVVVGSVGPMTVDDYHADVAVKVRPDVRIAENAIARVGQTSLLGSMHLSLDPPLGEAPRGKLAPGATVPLDRSSTYPSTERTLSSLAAVVNGGGLGQVGDIIRTVGKALGGHEQEARDVLTRLDDFIGTFDRQREDVVATLRALDRLSAQVAGQRDVIAETLRDLPPALEVLIDVRPQLMSALDTAREFFDVTTRLVNDSQNDLVTNLNNLGPTLKALADVGPEIDSALGYVTVLPYGQNVIDRGVKGDYLNLYIVLDLTRNRLKRTLLSGTRFGDPHLPLVPAPGDRGYDAFYAAPPPNDPLQAPIMAPPTEAAPVVPAAPAPSTPVPPQGG